jgi:hypothetical protein
LSNKRTNHSCSRNEEEEETPMNPDDQRRERREIALLVAAIVGLLALAVLYGSSFQPPLTGAEQAALTRK